MAVGGGETDLDEFTRVAAPLVVVFPGCRCSAVRANRPLLLPVEGKVVSRERARRLGLPALGSSRRPDELHAVVLSHVEKPFGVDVSRIDEVFSRKERFRGECLMNIEGGTDVLLRGRRRQHTNDQAGDAFSNPRSPSVRVECCDEPGADADTAKGARMPLLKLEGQETVSLYFEDYGQGKPVVLIHG